MSSTVPRIEPGPGQESVWDYPRPPVLRPDGRRAEVKVGRVTIAATREAILVLETSHPPGWYFPPGDVDPVYLRREPGSSSCEWKGDATYWSAMVGEVEVQRVAWSYPRPTPDYVAIAGYLSFYPQRVECLVEGRRVEPQGGGFYGGWVTPEVVGPFKGAPGTMGW